MIGYVKDGVEHQLAGDAAVRFLVGELGCSEPEASEYVANCEAEIPGDVIDLQEIAPGQFVRAPA